MNASGCFAPPAAAVGLPVASVTAFRIAGVAIVLASPYRSIAEAEQLARRIAAAPDDYLAVCRMFDVPGVLDERRPR